MALQATTVLLVEDSPLFRQLLGEHLTAMGFTRILEAPNGRTAMELLKHERPHLVCMDLMLPDVSGYDVCEYIRGQDEQAVAQVPILVISNRALMLDRAQAVEVGANGYLAKPFTHDELVALVEQVLAGSSRNG